MKNKVILLLIFMSLFILSISCSEIDKEGYANINIYVSGEDSGVNDLGIKLESVYAIFGDIYLNEENNPINSCSESRISVCDYYLVDLVNDSNILLTNDIIMSNRYKGFSFNISYDESKIHDLKIPANKVIDKLNNYTSGIYIKGIFPIIGEKEYIVELDNTINLVNIPGKVLILTKDSTMTINLTVRLQEWLIGIDYFKSDEEVIAILKKNIEDITSYEYLIIKE